MILIGKNVTFYNILRKRLKIKKIGNVVIDDSNLFRYSLETKSIAMDSKGALWGHTQLL